MPSYTTSSTITSLINSMEVNSSNIGKSAANGSSETLNFFKTLGVELDFGENKKVSTKFDYCMLISTGADVCYKGRKIIGSAQYRKQGYILQHGSILFNYNKQLLEKLFKEEVSMDSITTVNEILPDMTKEKFVELFENYLKSLN